MAKKKARKKRPVTLRRIKAADVVTDGKWRDIEAVHHTWYQSDVTHVTGLIKMIENPNTTLSIWEIELLNEFVQKFNARYNNPLAKALR